MDERKWLISQRYALVIPLESKGGNACATQAVCYVLQSCHIVLNLADNSWK